VRADSTVGAARLQVREYLNGVKVGATTFASDVQLSTVWQKLVVDHVTGAAGSTLDLQILGEPTRPSARMFVDDVAIRIVPTSPATAALAAVGVREAAANLPTLFPNPIRDRGLLSLSIARPGALRVALYDINGRKVRTVFDRGDASAGSHHFEFDRRNDRGERLDPGVFFYRIDSAEGVRYGRFVVIN
jgi:hypothetical protein